MSKNPILKYVNLLELKNSQNKIKISLTTSIKHDIIYNENIKIRYERNELKMLKTAKCLNCGRKHNVENLYKITSPSRNYFYVCEYCLELENGYHDENLTFSRKPASHGITWSIELETADRNIESNWLYQYNFLPTTDGSIGGTEWKSPIWRSLRGMAQLFRTIEKKCIFDGGCGTHLNIGTYNREKIEMLRRFYHSLFVPVCEHLKKYPEETEQLFGRYFTYYACEITENTNPTEHRNFINLQHDTHIEFRLCKFITAEQYMQCIKLCTEWTKTINNNFIAHFNDHEIDNGIKDITAYRKHKAKITANKMIRIFDKYAAML